MSKQVSGQWGEMCLEWESGPGLGALLSPMTLGQLPLSGLGSEGEMRDVRPGPSTRPFKEILGLLLEQPKQRPIFLSAGLRGTTAHFSILQAPRLCRTIPHPGPRQASLSFLSQSFLDSQNGTPKHRLCPHLPGSEGKTEPTLQGLGRVLGPTPTATSTPCLSLTALTMLRVYRKN